MEKIHFIAIGGSIMHNLAIALYKKGEIVSGSDDVIYDPGKSKLEQFNLLPESYGWFPEKITSDLDYVILGMHAKKDNPELIKALELNLTVLSFPEYIYESAKNMKRIAICGSHGKTTITAMIMHVLKKINIPFNYMVGAELQGFDTMVQLDDDKDLILIEGDEYLSSALQLKPKFLYYKPDITVLSGIAWDHYNVFRTLEVYIDQFRQLLNTLGRDSVLIYNKEDKKVNELINQKKQDFKKVPFHLPNYKIEYGQATLNHKNSSYSLEIFGKHNLSNLEAAKQVCMQLGVQEDKFYSTIQSFKGASKRLELLSENNFTIVYKDFAHSPSKVKASLDALKEFHPKRKLVACLELHTYSSLNSEFMTNYRSTMDNADIAIIFIDEQAMSLKNIFVTPETVKEKFNRDSILVISSKEKLNKELKNMNWDNSNLLFMSSGHFSNMDLDEIATFVTSKT